MAEQQMPCRDKSLLKPHLGQAPRQNGMNLFQRETFNRWNLNSKTNFSNSIGTHFIAWNIFSKLNKF